MKIVIEGNAIVFMKTVVFLGQQIQYKYKSKVKKTQHFVQENGKLVGQGQIRTLEKTEEKTLQSAFITGVKKILSFVYINGHYENKEVIKVFECKKHAGGRVILIAPEDIQIIEE